MKNGIQHVQPPAEILARMLAVRVHLDETPADHVGSEIVDGPSYMSGKMTS